MLEYIQWLGHGSFSIQGPPIVYINPWRVVRSAFLADLILIGHDHYDHCSVADVAKLRGPETIILGNERVQAQIPDAEWLRPWQSRTFDRMRITGIPAYAPNDIRHPREHNGLGFLISVNYYDIYYAGDTHLIPEMDRLNPDIAMLPIDNDGTLNVADAVRVVEKLKPRWVYPMNWGETGEGASMLDALEFKQSVGDRAQVILPQALKERSQA